jgi:hypothetical protein
MFSENSAVGLVDPGRDVSGGNSPSPLTSIAIGIFPSISFKIREIPLDGVFGCGESTMMSLSLEVL